MPLKSTRPRVFDRVAQLSGRVPRVQGDDDQARAGDRLVELEVAVTVGTDGHDAVTVAQTEAAQRAGEAAAAIPHLGVAQGHVATMRGSVLGSGRERMAQR